MKFNKYLSLFAIISFLAACGGAQPTQETTDETPVTETTITKTAGLKGQQLIAASDCLGCHKVQEKLVGPSYVDVAAKYDNNPDNVNYLATKIISGGQGVWGEIPMSAHPQITQQDAEEMVKYIFTLKPIK